MATPAVSLFPKSTHIPLSKLLAALRHNPLRRKIGYPKARVAFGPGSVSALHSIRHSRLQFVAVR